MSEATPMMPLVPTVCVGLPLVEGFGAKPRPGVFPKGGVFPLGGGFARGGAVVGVGVGVAPVGASGGELPSCGGLTMFRVYVVDPVNEPSGLR